MRYGKLSFMIVTPSSKYKVLQELIPMKGNQKLRVEDRPKLSLKTVIINKHYEINIEINNILINIK
jgi:hypothetical protein